MNEFEKQVIDMLAKVLEKQSEHDIKFNDINERFNTMENKLNTIMTQTAENSEMKIDVVESKKQLKRLDFEIELIKKYIRS